MKTAFASLAVTASAFSLSGHNSQILTSEDHEFIRFVAKYNKSYGTVAEFEFRSAQFKESLVKIAEHNSQNGTSTVGINKFSDYTAEEMKRLRGYKAPLNKIPNARVLAEEDLAAEVDWVKAGAVTDVKDQGQCGSCWAFSTTGSVEGAEFLATGKLVSFSEQQLVDCAGAQGNEGCNGGLMDNAFTYIEGAPLETEDDYPYTAMDGDCSYDASKGVGQVKSFVDVPANSVAQLKAAIAKAPVSVAIEADQMAFQSYTGGVITSGCGQQLDHGVLAVGYGTLSGTPYFLVKNSWGPSWGDNGYVRIGATSANVCGILSAASYPTEK